MPITPTFQEELQLVGDGYRLVAGIDEAGRGPWAGPVVAGAVILPEDWLRWRRRRRRTGKRRHWKELDPRELLRDSKLLSKEQRESLYGVITSVAIAYGVGTSTVEDIDRLGIVRATKQAMHHAIQAMAQKPDALIVDFVDLSESGIHCRPIVDGDALCGSVSAASILAKVTRDRLMEQMDRQYPKYGFCRHKGYGTEEHVRALRLLGPCPLHRRTFSPIKELVLQGRLFPFEPQVQGHDGLS